MEDIAFSSEDGLGLFLGKSEGIDQFLLVSRGTSENTRNNP